jgi:predicted short-subunit dehydrogenase-like oxidoreductase (DUF2520 family)
VQYVSGSGQAHSHTTYRRVPVPDHTPSRLVYAMLVPVEVQDNRSRPLGIAGAGRIGQALGRLLRERGEPVAAIAGRDLGRTAAAADFIGGVEPLSYEELPSRARCILIAVPDDALDSVAAVLARSGFCTGAAVHTCGTRGPEALAALAERGVSCAALHPLQTVTTPEQGLRALPEAAFAMDGSGEALDWALHIIGLLEGTPLRIEPDRRPLYHAAAVMASNYLTVLLDAAVLLMEKAGIGRDQSLRALAPLVRTSVENTLALGPAQALTGPIERGDTGTVAAHLQALAEVSETVRELYLRAGLHAVDLARRKTPALNREKMELLLRDGEQL